MIPRIAVLSCFLSPFRSGAEACVEEVVPRLREQFDFTIITAKLRRDLPNRDTLDDIPVRRIGIGHSIDKYLFPFLAPFAARRVKPDVIHAVLESYAGLALVFCRWIVPRAKRILTLQSTNTSLFLRPMHRCAHAITAISSVLIERAAKFGRTDSVLIPNGIDRDAISHACASHPKIPGRILFVGRLESMKGVDTLLTAFAKILNNKNSPLTANRYPLSLRIVGSGSQRQPLEQLAHDLGIADRVTFAGHIPPPAVYDEFAKAEIFCGLSRSEALGNVFLEAQAAGCAVMGTNVGGIPDIVKDGETGVLVPPDDAEAAAEKLTALLMNTKESSVLAKNAMIVSRAYDWQMIASKYSDLYAAISD